MNRNSRWNCVPSRESVNNPAGALTVADAPGPDDEFSTDWLKLDNAPLFGLLDLIGEAGAERYGPWPRGLPPDASPAMAGHHHNDPDPQRTSWLGLEELIAFDWNESETQQAILISNGEVPRRRLDPVAAQQHVTRFGISPLPRGWTAVVSHNLTKALEVPVSWRQQRSSLAGPFMATLVDLIKLDRRPDVDGVRIVFWYC